MYSLALSISFNVYKAGWLTHSLFKIAAPPNMFCMSQITLSVIHSEISRINFSNLDCFTTNSECVDVLRLILLSTKKMLKIIIYDENENNIIIPNKRHLLNIRNWYFLNKKIPTFQHNSNVFIELPFIRIQCKYYEI